MNNERCSAAEFALKAYSVGSDPAQFSVEQSALQQIAGAADLTEAPEDAVCSLVTDLLHYCEREKLDWSGDVIARACERFRAEERHSLRR